jgi:hypothetical protein
VADDKFQIRDEAALRSLVGTPSDTAAAKVLDRLNEAMKAFIRQSPLVFISTSPGGLPILRVGISP